MVIKKELIYPIFLECCKYVDDSFWENIFENLAYGKTPYGTYISKNFLCCSYKNKEFSYKIERKDPEELYKDVYNLLNNKLGILSSKEKVKQKDNFQKTEEKMKEVRQEWATIRKKNVKELILERYVLNMQKKYFLTVKQTKYLLSIIIVALMFKAISSDDIEYSDNKIHKINGIDFEKNKIIINKDIYNTEVDIIDDSVVETKNMIDNWEKYLNNLRKERNFVLTKI